MGYWLVEVFGVAYAGWDSNGLWKRRETAIRRARFWKKMGHRVRISWRASPW